MEQKLTKIQENFFKESKVRNEDGTIMVCYHGTKTEEDFHSFGNIKTEPGYWFSEDKDYAASHGVKTLECYINLKRPF